MNPIRMMLSMAPRFVPVGLKFEHRGERVGFTSGGGETKMAEIELAPELWRTFGVDYTPRGSRAGKIQAPHHLRVAKPQR